MKYIKSISSISELLINSNPKSFVSVNTGDEMESIVDFRSITLDEKWESAQKEYIKYHEFYKTLDSVGHFKKEIDTVKEIYQDEFHLSGRILDVGGAQGRLRHFLNSAELAEYICIDPFPEAFEGFGKMQNMLNTYYNLKDPLYFMAAFAESLPFKDGVFDWVHMRSVLDHFSDPEKALLEAKRVLKPGGKILIGVTIKKGEWLKGIPKPPLATRISRKAKSIFSVSKKSSGRYNTAADDHVSEWSYEELRELLNKTGFKILKEHRQKAPWQNCIYLSIG